MRTPQKIVADELKSAEHARTAVASIAKGVPFPKHANIPVEYWPDDKREAYEHASAVRDELIAQLAARFVALMQAQAGTSWAVPRKALDGSVHSLATLDARWLTTPIASVHKAAYLDAEIDITLAAYAFSAVRAQFADHGNVGFDVRSDITKSRICFVYTAQIIEPWSYIVHVTRAGFSLAALAEHVASIAQRVS